MLKITAITRLYTAEAAILAHQQETVLPPCSNMKGFFSCFLILIFIQWQEAFKCYFLSEMCLSKVIIRGPSACST